LRFALGNNSGYCPAIKHRVLQRGVTSVEDLIRSTKVAESVEVTAPLLDTMKAPIQASEKQAAQVQTLTIKVASFSSKQLERYNVKGQDNSQTRDHRAWPTETDTAEPAAYQLRSTG
jgi:hypothetical protein